MRYGLITYGDVRLYLDGNDFANLGDWVQTIAMENLYKQWGIDDYVSINIEDIPNYDGEFLILPFFGYFSISPKMHASNVFPISKKIIPVFISMHIHDQWLPNELENMFKNSRGAYWLQR